MPNIAVLIQPRLREELFTPESYEALRACGTLLEHTGEKPANEEEAIALMRDAQVVVSSWGMVRMTPEMVAAAPELKMIVYGAGSIKRFVSDEMWERGIRVCSAAYAIGYSVAEFTTGLTIVGLRGSFQRHLAMQANAPHRDLPRKNTYGAVVGVVSLGAVGRQVVQMLKPFGARILACDPYVPQDVVDELGVEMVDLNAMLEQVDCLTLHAPNLPETNKMIGREQLAKLKDGCLLINTSRGAVIDEAALAEELKTKRIFACLDVTDPEPPATDSPLRSLENVFLTPHIAGGPSVRIGEQCAEEVRRFIAGEKQVFEVQPEQLAKMA
jgi:phosphoglycerate dehydrogenase-like enzyme